MKFKNYFHVFYSLLESCSQELLHIKTLNTRTYLKPLHIITIRRSMYLVGISTPCSTWQTCFKSLGKCKNWYYNAKRSGYRTGHTPKRYAVMQSTAGYYGHVAVVERVYSNGSIKVSEYNYNRPSAYGTRYLSKWSARNYNYIY